MADISDLANLSDYVLNIITKANFIYTIFLIILIGLLKWMLNKFLISKFEDLALRYKWRKITTYLSFLIGGIMIPFLWLKNFQLGTFLGLFTAGVAIALRDLLSNFIGWIFIVWKRPFSIGDRIEIGGTAGDVVDVRIFQFSITEIGNWVEAEQSTGRIVHIPNKKVFNTDLANYTADFPYIWNEIPVLITFESDWQKAKNMFTQIVEGLVGEQIKTARRVINRSSRKYMIYYGTLTPIVYTRLKESGVLLTIRYLCDPRQRRGTEEEIWEAILKEVESESSIEFAYPTQRLYFKNNKVTEEEKHNFSEDKVSESSEKSMNDILEDT